MAENKPLSIRAVQVAALFISTTMTGVSLSLSAFVIPRLLESPTSLMLQQFSRSLERGHRTMPPTSQAAALTYLYLAYRFGLREGITRPAIPPGGWLVLGHHALHPGARHADEPEAAEEGRRDARTRRY